MSDSPAPADLAASAGDGPGRRRSRWLGIARVVYLTVLVALLAWLVFTRRGDIAALVTGARPGWLLVAFVLALGQLAPSVLVWTIATRRLDHKPVPLRAVADATARSVPTRYLPGSVWYALGRATILRRDLGVSARTLGATAALETILAVVVAIAGGSALLTVAGRLPDRPGFLAAWFIGLALAGSPPVVNAVLAWVARRRGDVEGGQAPVRLGWATYGWLLAATVLHWLWSATTFTVYLQAFPGLTTLPVVEVAGAFLIAWVIGFLAIFAPQGAGVFEGAVAAMLVGGTGAGAAAVVVAGYRAMMLVRDAVVFSVASLRGRRR